MMNILERKLLDESKETIPWMNLDHGNSNEKLRAENTGRRRGCLGFLGMGMGMGMGTWAN